MRRSAAKFDKRGRIVVKIATLPELQSHENSLPLSSGGCADATAWNLNRRDELFLPHRIRVDNVDDFPQVSTATSETSTYFSGEFLNELGALIFTTY